MNDGEFSAGGLLNRQLIKDRLTDDDRWCRSHGAREGTDQLGAGLVYYALAYSFQAKVCVCLGSGGGFVPRMMRQAQRDLDLPDARTILVDGADEVPAERKSIWGSPAWLTDDSPFRRDFPDVEIVMRLTEDAYHQVFVPQGLRIDYLHIDADHHYDGVKKDWELYRQLVPDDGIISLHDTVNYRPPCGVPQLVEEIRREGEYDLLDLPIAYGTAILRKRTDSPRRVAETS